MNRDFSIKGAVKRLSNITVSDIREMSTKDLSRTITACRIIQAPLEAELSRKTMRPKTESA